MHWKQDSRQVSHIGNADVGVNVDLESHPRGAVLPRYLYFSLVFEPNSTFAFSIFLEKDADEKRAIITNKENETCLALDLKLLKIPYGEILCLCSRLRPRFQFAKPPEKHRQECAPEATDTSEHLITA